MATAVMPPTKPSARAVPARMRPEGIGRRRVRAMALSPSRSRYILSVFAEPTSKVAPTSTINHVMPGRPWRAKPMAPAVIITFIMVRPGFAKAAISLKNVTMGVAIICCIKEERVRGIYARDVAAFAHEGAGTRKELHRVCGRLVSLQISKVKHQRNVATPQGRGHADV